MQVTTTDRIREKEEQLAGLNRRRRDLERELSQLRLTDAAEALSLEALDYGGVFLEVETPHEGRIRHAFAWRIESEDSARLFRERVAMVVAERGLEAETRLQVFETDCWVLLLPDEPESDLPTVMREILLAGVVR